MGLIFLFSGIVGVFVLACVAFLIASLFFVATSVVMMPKYCINSVTKRKKHNKRRISNAR